jgi:hypothetical protein
MKTLNITKFIEKRDAYLKRLKLARKAGKTLQLKPLSWFVCLLVLVGCAKDPTSGQSVPQEVAAERFEVTKHFGGKAWVYHIKDKQTGHEYLGFSKGGLIELPKPETK